MKGDLDEMQNHSNRPWRWGGVGRGVVVREKWYSSKNCDSAIKFTSV